MNPLLLLGLPKWTRWLAGGLAMALLVGLLWLRGNHYERDRDAWKSAFNAQKAALVAAQLEAQAKAAASRITAENTLQAIAERNDHALELARANARSAVDRYADAHRVRPQAVGGAGCKAPTSPLPVTPPLDNGAGDTADMVAISRADFDSLTEAALRAAVNREWGQSLIDEGLALPEAEFGR